MFPGNRRGGGVVAKGWIGVANNSLHEGRGAVAEGARTIGFCGRLVRQVLW